MKFLITGSSGQLGQEWVYFLNETARDFKAFSSQEMDITDRSSVEKRISEIRPDVVINCAAYTNVDGAESEAEKAFLVNESGVENLAEICAENHIKLVHFSTDYVFAGSAEDSEKYPDGYPEIAETDPINVYGESKEAGEKLLQASECDWLLIRVSWLCGRFGSNFVKTMLRLGKDRDELSVVEDQVGCPSFVFDVVDKTMKLLEQNERGIFHISCKEKISWADFAQGIFFQSGLEVVVKKITSDQYSFTAERPKFSLLSNKKAEAAGLQVLSWKEGLQQLLEQISVDPA